MTPRDGPPFRADHVGSLLRPRALIAALKAHRAGILDDVGLEAARAAAIRDAVRQQEAVGLPVVGDGEFRRVSYWAGFVARVDGLEAREAAFAFRDEEGRESAFTAPHVTAPLRRSRAIAGDEFAFVAGLTDRVVKITLPSPPTMHFWRLDRGIDPAAYVDAADFFADLARVYAEELADLAARGAAYVQLDDVLFAMLCDPAVRARVAEAGMDADRLIDDYIGLCNRAIAGRPPGLAVAMHIRRGNYKSHFLSAGGYDAAAERLFAELAVDGFLLEYDTPRAGDFTPLRFVPPGRRVVLGLVSTKTPGLEDAEALRRRIDEAAKILPLDQLALSPQCGFASTLAGNPFGEADQWAKLARVVEVAERVWG